MKRVFPQESAADSHSPISNGIQPGALGGSRRVQKSAAVLGIALSFGTSAPLLFEPESALAVEGPIVAVVPAAEDKADVPQARLVTNRGDLAATIYHTVEEGESLWQIAEDHQADLGFLKAANSIAPDEVLKVGQVLRVPSVVEDIAGAGDSGKVHRLALSDNVRGSVGGDLTVVFGEELSLGEGSQEGLESEADAELDKEALAKLAAEELSQESYELTAAALRGENETALLNEHGNAAPAAREDAASAEVDTDSVETRVAALPSELPNSMPFNAVEADALEDLEVAAAGSAEPSAATVEQPLEGSVADLSETAPQVALSDSPAVSRDWQNQEIQPLPAPETAVETPKSLTVAALRDELSEAEAVPSEPVPNISTTSYRVKAGDTFWKIATRHGLSPDELLGHNAGRRPETLMVGDSLNIPVGAADPTSGSANSAIARASQPQAQESRDVAIQDHLARIREAANRDIDPEELKARIIAVRESLERAESVDAGNAPLEYHSSTSGSSAAAPAADLSQIRPQAQPASQSLVARSSAPAQAEWTVTDAADSSETVQIAARTAASESVTAPEAVLPPTTVPENLMAAAPMSPDVYRASPQLPVGEVVTPGMPMLPDSGEFLPEAPNRFNGYVWPTQGTFTSGYGWRWGRMHRGIDIAGPVGTPIIAAAPGVVVRSGWNSGGYGNLVDIRHADGSMTRYAHNSRLLVREGQQVSQGQQIAEMGSTGYSTGPHLHFEVHLPNSGTVNPLAYLPGR